MTFRSPSKNRTDQWVGGSDRGRTADREKCEQLAQRTPLQDVKKVKKWPNRPGKVGMERKSERKEQKKWNKISGKSDRREFDLIKGIKKRSGKRTQWMNDEHEMMMMLFPLRRSE